MKLKRAIKTAVRVAVSGCLLALVLSNIDLYGLLGKWRQVDWFMLALVSLVLFAAGITLKVLRLNAILAAQGIHVPPSFLFKLHLRRVFLGAVAPGGVLVSDGYSIVEMARGGKGVHKIFSAVFVERVVGIVALLMLSFLGVLPVILFWDGAAVYRLLWPLLLSVTVCAIGLLVGLQLIRHRLLIGMTALPFRLNESFMEFLHAMPRYLSARNRGLNILAYSIISQGTLVVWAHAIVYLLDYSLPFSVTLAVIPLTLLVSTMPFFFQGLGAQEAAFIFFFVPFGLTATEAASFSLLFTTVRLVTRLMAVCGWLSPLKIPPIPLESLSGQESQT